MKNKLISMDKNLAKWLDNLTEKEEMLALYLNISKGNSPKNLSIVGFFMNPLTILPSGAARVAKNLENKLRETYKQYPLVYIRLSTNIPMLQRIMVLEQPTTLRLLMNPSLKKNVRLALECKLRGLNVPPSDFLKGFTKLSGGFIVEALKDLWNID